MNSKIKIVESLISEGEQFNFNNFCIPRNDEYRGRFAGSSTPEWQTFKTRVNNIVKDSLEDNSPAVLLVNKALMKKTTGNGIETFLLVKNNLITALKQLLAALQDDVYGELITESSQSISPALSNKVFIVHGHDNELKLDVERFIREIGLQPVVLHREIDRGQTIIEKFEENSDVGFAFILLTPDEIAYTADQKDKKDTERKWEYRARPNVIFEYGYFIGKLGRERVCCLSKGNVTVPSDISGLLYKSINNTVDEQGMAIIRELRAVGYTINM